jgi:hypothetical protein
MLESSDPASSGSAELTPAEMKALRITTTFETGRPLTFARVAGDFDGMGLSFGLLQWNIGSGTLQPMLLDFDRDHPDHFDDVFGPHADTVRHMLRQPKEHQLRFAKSLNNERKQIVEPWATYLQRLGDDPAFQRIQLRQARGRMRLAADYARQLGLRSERALALMFDNVTQNGDAWLHRRNRGPLIAQRHAAQERQQGRPLSERELLAVIAGVVADTVDPQWRNDVLGRRMMIVNGQGARGGRVWDLGREFGLSDQPFARSTGTPPGPVAPSGPTVGSPTELAAVRAAMLAGARDVNALSDLVFYQRHPERRGRPLGRRDRALAAEWLTIKSRLVEPALRALSGATANPGTSAFGRELSLQSPGGGLEHELEYERGRGGGGRVVPSVARPMVASMAPLRAQRFLTTSAFARHYPQQLAMRHRGFDPRSFARRFYRAPRRRFWWPRRSWWGGYGGYYPYPYDYPSFDGHVAYVDGVPILYRRVGDRVMLVDALDAAAMPDGWAGGVDGAVVPWQELESIPPSGEIARLCAQAGQIASQLSDELRRVQVARYVHAGMRDAAITRIRERGARWINRVSNEILPIINHFHPNDLDRLTGCLTRVESVIGWETIPLRRLRAIIRPLLGMTP